MFYKKRIVLFALILFTGFIYGQPCYSDFEVISDLCENQTVKFEIQDKTVGNSCRWIWGDGNEDIESNLDIKTHVYTNSGNYTVKLIIYGNSSCKDSFSTNITVNKNPITDFTFDNNLTCSYTPIKFTNTSTNEVSPSYIWNFNTLNNDSSEIENPTFTFDEAIGDGQKSYGVELTVTNSNGCSSTLQKIVQVLNRPNAILKNKHSSVLETFFNDDTTFYRCVLNSDSVMFRFNQNSTPNTITKHSIDWGDNTEIFQSSSFSSNESHKYGIGYYNLKYSVENQNNCFDTAYYSIFYGSQPAGGIVGPGNETGCSPLELAFQIQGTENNPPGTIYTISFNDGSTPDTFFHPPPNEIIHEFKTTSCDVESSDGFNIYDNSFSARFLAENPCDKKSGAVLPIYISSPVVIDFTSSSNSTSCINNIISFEDKSIGSSIINNSCDKEPKRIWTIEPNSGWTSTSNLGDDYGYTNNNFDAYEWDNGDKKINVTFQKEGIYRIKILSGNGCSYDTLSKSICIEEIPESNIYFDSLTGCAPLTINTIDTSINIISCNNYQYNWSVENTDGWSFANATNSSSNEPSFLFSKSGEYYIENRISNSCGSIVKKDTISVKGKPSGSIDSIQDFCNTAKIKPFLQTNDSLASIYEYNWIFNNGIPNNSNNNNPDSISYLTSGEYKIIVNIKNECGKGTDSITFNVNAPPNLKAKIDNNTLCRGDSSQIKLSGGLNYTISPTLNTEFINDDSIIITGLESKNYTIEATDYIGCSTDTSISILVNDLPNLILQRDTQLCEYENVNINISGADTFIWTPNTFLTTLNSETFNIQPFYFDTITYIAEGIDTITKCSSFDSIVVSIKQTPKLILNLTDTICSGDKTFIELNSNISNSQFSYTFIPNALISGALDGNNSLIEQQIINLSNNIQELKYLISISSDNCNGQDTLISVFIKPSPVLNDLTNDTICSGTSPDTIIFNSNDENTIYSWTTSYSGNISPTPSSSSGNFLLITEITNYSQSNSSVNYIITPELNRCIGSSKEYNLIIKPSATVTNNDTIQHICSNENSTEWIFESNLPNSLFSWQTYSNNISVGHFLNGDGNIPQANIINNSNNIDTITYVVNAKTSDGVTCQGESQNFHLIIYPLPEIINADIDTTICSGDSINLNFESSLINSEFYWTTNSSNSISGYTNTNGYSINDSLTNNSGARDSITYFIKALSNNCFGPEYEIKVYVKPNLDISLDLIEDSICSNDSVFNTFTTLNNDVIINWRTDTSAYVNGNSSGSGPILKELLSNTSDSIITLNYYINANYQGCKGENSIFPVTINPIPSVNIDGIDSICSGQITNINLSSNVNNSDFSFFPNTNLNVNGQNIGSGNNINQTLVNLSDNVQQIQYTIKPSINQCSGIDSIYSVYIKPKSELVNILNDTVLCSGENSKSVNLYSSLPNSYFIWEYLSDDSISPKSDTIISNIINKESFINTSTSSKNVSYKIFVNHLNCITDTGYFNITINPRPIITNTNMIDSTCSRSYTDKEVILKSNLTGTTFSWYSLTDSNVQGSTLSGNNTIPIENLTYEGDSFGIVDYIIIPDNNSQNLSCPGDTDIYRIYVFPKPESKFTFSPNSGGSPLLIAINNISSLNSTQFDWYSDNTWINNSKAPSLTFTNEGIIDSIYKLSLITTTDYNCKDTSSDFITVFPLPIPDFEHNETCIGFETSFIDKSIETSGKITSWKWTFIADNIDSLNQNTFFTFDSAKTYDVTLEIKTDIGTSNSITKNVTIHPKPEVDFDFSTISCTDSIIHFTNLSFLDSLYHWDFANGLTSNLKSPSSSYVDTGFYDIKLIARTKFNCVDSLTKTIEIITDPKVNFELDNNDGCEPLEVMFSNHSEGKYLSYEWNFGDTTTSNDTIPDNKIYLTQNNDLTIYNVNLSVSNKCGENSNYDSVKVNPLPIANFQTNVDEGCTPLEISFMNTSIGRPNSFNWDFDNGNTSNSKNPDEQVFIAEDNDTIYTIVLEVSNECGSDSIAKSISVLKNSVTAFFSAPKTRGCAPLHLEFMNHSTGETINNWDFGDGNTSNIKQANNIFQNSGIYNVRLIVTNGCSFDTMTTEIEVLKGPELDFSLINNRFCEKDTVIIFNKSVNTIGYRWVTSLYDTIYNTNPSFKYDSSGNYEIKLIGYSSINNCKDSISKSFRIYDNPEILIDYSDTIGCEPFTLNFLNNSLYSNFFNWRINNLELQGNNPYINLDQNGLYSLNIVASNYNNCVDSTKQWITVLESPTSNFEFLDTISCSDTFNIITENYSSLNCQYKWLLNEQLISNNYNTEFNLGTIGQHNVTLEVINSLNCKDTLTKNVNRYIKPQPSILTDERSGCQTFVTNLYSKSVFQKEWDYLGETYITDTFHIEINDTGLHTLKLIEYGQGNCSDSTSIILEVFPKTEAYFTFVESDTIGLINFKNESSNSTIYSWQYQDAEFSNFKNPSYRFQKPGVAYVKLITNNSYNCIDSTVSPIDIPSFNTLSIPNAFAPGKQNDLTAVFMPVGISLKDFHIKIIDSWGKLIWESKLIDINGSPMEYWDGNDINGNKLPSDVYIWMVEKATFIDGTSWEGMSYDGGKAKRFGTVTLIR